MRVLITGTSGFIGSHVLKYFLEQSDWDITTISRSLGPISSRVIHIVHDLSQPIPYIGEFDYILNFASESHVEKSIQDPVNFISNNILSTMHLLEYARKHMPKVFLQFSTDEVYGAFGHKEWDVLLPSNPYAASKASQEMIAIAYWKTYKVPVVITNSNNIIGRGQNKANFIPKLMEYIESGKEIPIYTVNGKPGKRYWNPVANVCSAVDFILEGTPASYPTSDRPDRYSLGGGKELDNLEMAKLVAQRLGKPLKYTLVEAESVRPGYDESYSKTASNLEKIGWQPVQTLEEGLVCL